MKTHTLLESLLLAASTIAGVASAANAKTCNSYNIPVTVTSTNLVFGLPHFQTDFDVADFVDTITSRNVTTASSVIAPGVQVVTATYNIAATFCRPGNGKPDSKKKSTVLIATHGLGFDKTYWDPQLNKTMYSFTDWAIGQGYSIFSYDRLGVGASSRVSGYVAQLSNQVAILAELTKLVKAGQFVGGTGKPPAVVLLGHSFGSVISITALANNLSIADGIVLTGFSLNKTFVNGLGFAEAGAIRIASFQSPAKWRRLDTGYLTNADVLTNVATFFKAPDYDPAVAQFAENTKAPLAVTELLTASSITNLPTAFTGPAMIMSGQFDFIFCMSDCDGLLENPGAEVFSHAKSFKAVSFPGAGHGLNLHLNAAESFKEITDFLTSNGL
ncbi:Alpha/Beta hydrolase protein [Lasiosphaeria miniovina]|uniref:Alpha/Beta hydrolase protein n=1 Tax=Lasiosphaeria miniovina TaxID=1954250 RepID=A0AA40ALA4_9PEZI|nr:Alpha/Beta hydrolase protein [Lasiosphaeria miniovina]KAK0717924.1 Alpha/Beta hydrolase protein [Lasiosphaeria miniovina]